jgi:hypothetical protein
MSDDGADPSVMRPVRLRPMTCEDVAASVPLLAQLGYEMSLEELARRVGAVLATPNHSLLVAEIEGRVVGVLHVFVRPAIENPRTPAHAFYAALGYHVAATAFVMRKPLSPK